MIRLVLGLILAMGGNILLGGFLARFKKEFDKEKFTEGMLKALSILLGGIFMYICGYLNPDILVININDKAMNLIDAMKTIFIAGIALYGYKDLVKLKDIIGVKINESEVEEIETNFEVNDEIGVG